MAKLQLPKSTRDKKPASTEGGSVVEMCDKIEDLFNSIPDKRKKKDYEVWRNSINSEIEKVNKLANFKLYNKVK